MLIGGPKRPNPAALLWPAALVVWGPGSKSSFHRHHCIQLILGLRETLRVREQPRQAWKMCGGVLIRPDASHEVDARNTDVLIAFVDAESELGATLLDRISDEVTIIPMRDVAKWRSILGEPASLDAARVEPWLKTEFLQDLRSPRLDLRVKRALRLIRDKLAEPGEISLSDLATKVRLSPSRLMHLFTTSVGVPLRPYVLWLRMQRAAGELASGRSATEAAHAAGFSDAAHLTRTFRRMLGATPRDIVKRQPATRDLQVVA